MFDFNLRTIIFLAILATLDLLGLLVGVALSKKIGKLPLSITTFAAALLCFFIAWLGPQALMVTDQWASTSRTIQWVISPGLIIAGGICMLAGIARLVLDVWMARRIKMLKASRSRAGSARPA